MRRVMTDEQIQEAKRLRVEHGYTKRKLAELYKVSGTTIFDNVLNKLRRVTLHIVPVPCCSKCEIMLTTDIDIKNRFVPMNYKINGMCLDCYLRERGIHYGDVMAILDYYGN